MLARRLSNNNYTVQSAQRWKVSRRFFFLHFLPTGAAAFLAIGRAVGQRRMHAAQAQHRKLRSYKTDTRRDSQSIQYQQ